MIIKIERAKGGRYQIRASVQLEDTWRRAPGGSGVCGQGTEEGPWAEAFGNTADEALLALYVVVGRLALQLGAQIPVREP